jgi:hypothetical protein
VATERVNPFRIPVIPSTLVAKRIAIVAMIQVRILTARPGDDHPLTIYQATSIARAG